MKIEIDDIKETRQLEDENWKAAIYFTDKFSADFLQLKKRAKETGRKMILTLQTEQAQVVPYEDVLLGDIHNRAELLADFIKSEIDKRKPAPPKPEVHEPVDLIGEVEVDVVS